MISVTVERGPHHQVRAFTAVNHGSREVCAAVSLMVLNTVNSIEALTQQAFTCDYHENGGFIQFKMDTPPNRDASLLLDSLMLGLHSVQAQYRDEIEILEK